MGAMEFIRNTYGVPAKRGMRVAYTGHGTQGEPDFGTITSATHSGHLKIRLDRFKHSMKFHPTWELRYLASPPAAQGSKEGGGHE